MDGVRGQERGVGLFEDVLEMGPSTYIIVSVPFGLSAWRKGVYIDCDFSDMVKWFVRFVFERAFTAVISNGKRESRKSRATANVVMAPVDALDN